MKYEKFSFPSLWKEICCYSFENDSRRAIIGRQKKHETGWSTGNDQQVGRRGTRDPAQFIVMD